MHRRFGKILCAVALISLATACAHETLPGTAPGSGAQPSVNEVPAAPLGMLTMEGHLTLVGNQPFARVVFVQAKTGKKWDLPFVQPHAAQRVAQARVFIRALPIPQQPAGAYGLPALDLLELRRADQP